MPLEIPSYMRPLYDEMVKASSDQRIVFNKPRRIGLSIIMDQVRSRRKSQGPTVSNTKR